MSAGPVPPWPVALVTGFLGSGKTTLIRALLSGEQLRDTLVVVNEFGEIGLDHHLIAAVHGDVVLLRGGCLCCQVRQDLVRTLRQMHLRWVQGELPPFARVVVETSGMADAASVVATLTRHPLLADPFALRSVTTLVDAEHGEAQLAAHEITRRQVSVADHLLLTKPDRASPEVIARVGAVLSALNPVADRGICLNGNASAEALFEPWAGVRPELSSLRADHEGDFTVQVLTVPGALAWAATQHLVADLLASEGDRLLRLKGVLRIREAPLPIVVQAVHHSFYPLATLPAWPETLAANTMVLIRSSNIAPDPGWQVRFEACATV